MRSTLPYRSGFYSWHTHDLEWTYLAETMTAPERWAMVLEAPVGEGGGYATLKQVLRTLAPDDDIVRQATEILGQGMACLTAADQNVSGGFESATKLAVTVTDFQIFRFGSTGDQRENLKLHFPPEELNDREPLATPLGTMMLKGSPKRALRPAAKQARNRS